MIKKTYQKHLISNIENYLLKFKEIWFAWILMIFVLLVTIYATYYIKTDIDYISKKEFDSACKEIRHKINMQLHAQSQLLRSGAAFFSSTDTITRNEWQTFYKKSEIQLSFPGIQGYGFSLIIPEKKLAQHIQKIRNEGYHDYTVWPVGNRDLYSSIIFLEPFTDRNLRAFGFDMMSEPIRSKAMEMARDMNIVILSGKVILVQETETDVQAGNLMYAPVYRKGEQINTIEQRRKAIIGWVYSPYRMSDLISGIFKDSFLKDYNRLYFQIFDGTKLLPESLLFESYSNKAKNKLETVRFSKHTTINFNEHLWTFVFTQTTENRFVDYISAWTVLFGGTVISLLLFFLIRSLINTKFKAKIIAKKLTNDLKKSEVQFRNLLENMMEGCQLIDYNWKYIFINKNADFYNSRTRNELIGKKITDLWPDIIKTKLYVLAKRCMEEQKHQNLENEFIFPDGTKGWFELRIQPVPEGIFILSNDITESKHAKEKLIIANNELAFQYHEKEKLTAELEIKVEERTKQLSEINKNLQKEIKERKEAEEEIIRSEERFRNVFENSPIGKSLTNIDGKLKVNKAFSSITGYSEKELSKLNWNAITHPDDIEKSEKTITSLITGEKKSDRYQKRYIHKTGKIVWTDLSTFLQRDKNGNPLYFITSISDITESKNYENELTIAKIEAEKANLTKSEFLANMSHEIRTPLNAVLGYAELLNLIVEDKIQKDYTGSIISSGRSLLNLINDILDLSKIEAGKLELMFEYVNTNSFFNEFKRIFSHKMMEKGLELRYEIESGIPEGIYIDEVRLRQILFNLLGNAIKFTENGYVKLKVYVENPQLITYRKDKTKEFIDLIIEIEDTGIGISKEFQKELFKPFMQQNQTKKFGGTGLGLSITQRLLALMNGTIQVQSELNKGSIFKVIIPHLAYLRSYEQKTNEIQINPADIEFNKATILITDDVEHNRKLILDALKYTNITVLEAENGLLGFNLAKEQIPDLIIADIQMPILDGYGLLKKVKEEDTLKHIPVIAYSASVMKKQKERIYNSQFAGLLIKPIRISELYIELMNFLPYKSLKNDISIQKITNKNFIKEIVNINDLIKSLETFYAERWKTFATRQPMDEICDFGKELIELSKVHNASIIAEFGDKLKCATKDYNIKDIINLINEYPKIIERLKGLN